MWAVSALVARIRGRRRAEASTIETRFQHLQGAIAQSTQRPTSGVVSHPVKTTARPFYTPDPASLQSSTPRSLRNNSQSDRGASVSSSKLDRARCSFITHHGFFQQEETSQRPAGWFCCWREWRSRRRRPIAITVEYRRQYERCRRPNVISATATHHVRIHVSRRRPNWDGRPEQSLQQCAAL